MYSLTHTWPFFSFCLPWQEREGRWWWEDTAQKECGLHSGNISMSSGGEEEAQVGWVGL